MAEICDFYRLEYNVMDDEIEVVAKNDDARSTEEILRACIEKLNGTELENVDRKQRELHSRKLVEVYKHNQADFIELWGQSFVDRMNPKFMPNQWRVSLSTINV